MGKRWIVFEEAWARDVSQRFFQPKPGDTWLSWEELLTLCEEPQPADYFEARAAFIEALQSTPIEKGDWFATVERLRETPLNNLDDVEFCFSHLPASEKNGFLKSLLRFYFQSPLIQDDRLARTTRVIQKDGMRQSGIDANSFVLVQARIPSPVFRDLAASLSAASQDKEYRLCETWDWNPSSIQSKRRPVFLWDPEPTAVLDRLCEQAKRLALRSKVPVPLFFEGTEASKAYLKLKLAAFGINLEDTSEAKKSPPEFYSDYFQRIRRCALPLSERLKLAYDWTRSADPKATEDSLEAWLNLQGLASDRKEILRNLPPTAPTNEPPGRIILLPFHPLPSNDSRSIYFFEAIGETSNSLAFDMSERFLLRAAGFEVPEAAPHRERNAEKLAALSKPSSGRNFVFVVNKDCLPSGVAERKLELRKSAQSVHSGLKEASFSPPTIPLSASSLETYSNCPAQFFYSQLARLRPKIDPEDSFSLVFGKLVHATLERAFRENSWDRVDEACLLKTFDRAAEENRETFGISAWLKIALKKRFGAIAEKLPGLERALREALGPLTPARFEEDFEISLRGRRFRGRIDRLDRTESGASLVIDYKTGAVDFSPEQVKKGTSYQALIYALASNIRPEGSAGVLFYDLKKMETRRGILREDKVGSSAKKAFTRGHVINAESWDSILEEGKDHALRLIEQLDSGDFRPTPSAKSCEFCPYGVQCRSKHSWTGAQP